MDRSVRDLGALVVALEARLRRPLPGGAAHLRMAPRPRRFWTAGVIPDDARPAAALLLLYPRDGEAHVALTVRSRDLPSHRGQVSLPGGAVDPGETLEAAAIREAREEIGVSVPAARVIGCLSALHIPVSGYALHPVVAWSPTRPSFVASPREVERVVEVPVADLVDPAHLELETWQRDEHAYDVPFFRVQGEVVWGATAMVLAEFLEVLGAPPEPWGPPR